MNRCIDGVLHILYVFVCLCMHRYMGQKGTDTHDVIIPIVTNHLSVWSAEIGFNPAFYLLSSVTNMFFVRAVVGACL